MNRLEAAPKEAASEESPLLANGKDRDDNGTIERQAPSEGDAVTENEVPVADEPSTRRLVVIMSSVWLGCFLAALDQTIIATLSAPISASFNSLSLLSWLASAYLIANAALQPLSGRLTDILSRKTGLLFSNIFFCAGNLICGLATREWVMILGRVIAGMGGGGLTAISTFVGSDLVPLRKRGVLQGIGNICYGVGAGLGGVFGGWINDTWGWRNAFLIQVPFTVVSGILVFFVVDIPIKTTNESAWERIDVLGAVTLIVTLVLLLQGLNSGGNVVPWTHPLVLVTLPLSLVSLIIFIYVENTYAREPIIPVKLLLDRTVLSACLTNWFTTMSIFGIIFYGPIYFQVQGLSATQAGERLIPLSLGMAVGSISTGLIMRGTGRYYFLSIIVIVVMVISLAIVSTFHLDTPTWEPFVVFAFAGFGYSGMLTVTLLALISAVAHEHQAVVTSASYAFRSTGSAIGITVASAVFQNIIKIELWDKFGGRKGAAEVISKLRDNLDEIKSLPPEWKAGVMEVYMDALRGVFLTTLGIAVLGFLLPLRKPSRGRDKALENAKAELRKVLDDGKVGTVKELKTELEATLYRITVGHSEGAEANVRETDTNFLTINFDKALGKEPQQISKMHRPYRHLDKITRAHQTARQARRPAAKDKKTGLLELPMEVRLIIYRQLCTPIHHEWLDGEGEDLPGSCISFDFPPAVLLVNKRINAEAKVVFYGENTFVTHIETMDVDQDYDTVEADTVRRRIMLGHVKKAHIHLKLSGQLIAEWRWAGSMADYLDYIRRSMTTVVRDFIAAPALRLVVISFEDAINDDPWIPDLNYTAETLDPRELEEARYSALEILGSLEYLPVRISLELGKVSVDTADGYENIPEERFASTFGEIIASRAAEKVAPQNLASMVVI